MIGPATRFPLIYYTAVIDIVINDRRGRILRPCATAMSNPDFSRTCCQQRVQLFVGLLAFRLFSLASDTQHKRQMDGNQQQPQKHVYDEFELKQDL